MFISILFEFPQMDFTAIEATADVDLDYCCSFVFATIV